MGKRLKLLSLLHQLVEGEMTTFSSGSILSTCFAALPLLLFVEPRELDLGNDIC